jgi:hypothetical protein
VGCEWLRASESINTAAGAVVIIVEGGCGAQVGRVEVAGERSHDGVAFRVGVYGGAVEVRGVVWVGVVKGGGVGGYGCFCWR